jgi:DNA-binding MarR family transcriptional regulator
MPKPIENTQIIMDSFRRIVQSLRHSSNQCEQFSRLTGAQLFVLKHIKSNNALSINELAALTFTHQSSVSEVVGKLEMMGFVKRKKSAKDARKVELDITDIGKAKLKSGIMTAQENLINSIQTFSQEEVAKLAELLSHLISRAGLSDWEARLFFEDTNDNK